MERKFSKREGAVAFVDDYTAWVVGKSAEANVLSIKEVVNHALAWELRSGATFEGEKTALIHFIKNCKLESNLPVNIKGTEVLLKDEVKILGVIMDSGLRFKNHIKKISGKGLRAALALKRMRALTPLAARQLFNATVVPVIDYASSIWMHAVGSATVKTIRQVQKLGGQAITGAFNTVAGGVVKAEAYISPRKARHWDKALKLLMDLYTLPANHPLSHLSSCPCKRFKSPLQRVCEETQGIYAGKLEKIQPYIINPWEPRIYYEKRIRKDKADAAATLLRGHHLLITTAAVENQHGIAYGITFAEKSVWIARGERLDNIRILNTYIAKLRTVAVALRCAQNKAPGNSVILVTSTNLAVLQALSNPGKQLGQCIIHSIYNIKREMEQRGCKIH